MKRPSARAVDMAMTADRPQKMKIREIWIEKVIEFKERFGIDDGFLYLGLPGAEGKDIQMLIEAGVLTLTEAGSLSQESNQLVAAVESNLQAVVELQKRFPGLKILEEPFNSLVRGEGLTEYPKGIHEEYCRARIINMDLNTPLKGREEQGEIWFPIIVWIEKLSLLHVKAPRREWCLYLTLHGEFDWNDAVNQFVSGVLKDNLDACEALRLSTGDFIGNSFVEKVKNGTVLQRTLNRKQKQELLMLLVPKQILDAIRRHGWDVRTEFNLRYGSRRQAPMVTWVIELNWNSDKANRTNELHFSNLGGILRNVGLINENGELTIERDA